MKAGWEAKPFEKCIEKVTYTKKIPRKDFLSEGAFPIVSQEDAFINGYWNDRADVFRVPYPLVVFGDHTKTFKFIDFDFVLGADGVKILQPKTFLEPKFFFYQLQTASLESLGYARHYKLLKELNIKYPPLPEQRRIVGILDDAFEGIAKAVANAEANLNNARELFESHLNAIFSNLGPDWTESFIEELCKIGDGNHSSKYPKKSEMVPAGVPFIRGTNIIDGKISLDDILFITKEKHQILKKGHLKTGDVLFTNRGEIGKVAIVDERFNGANLNSQIAWLRCHSGLLPTYLFYFLQSGNMKAHFAKAKSGAALQQFTIKMLRAVKVSHPKEAQQIEIVHRLDELAAETKRLEAIYRQKLALLDELKQSLLHKAFSGEL